MSSQGEGRERAEPIVGSYANYVKVGHNAHEFLLDFGQAFRENDQVRVHTRIIAGPVFAKALLYTLQESLEQYEQSFGPIDEDGGGQSDDRS